MIITIVTLYRGDQCEHFVGAVKGLLSEEDQEKIAADYKLKGGEEGDEIYFCATTVVDDINYLKELDNISSSGAISGRDPDA